jgi:hypothetical protein
MHPQWDEVCDLTISGNGNLDGEFNLANGVRFAIHGTAYGDGVYQDEQGRDYPVDAGSIGCIRVEDVNDSEAWLAGVQTVEFTEPFELQYVDNVICFVNANDKILLAIDTDPVYEEEEA